MFVIKRDGSQQSFSIEKVKAAVLRCLVEGCNESVSTSGEVAEDVCLCVTTWLKSLDETQVVSVEDIQDHIEKCLMQLDEFEAAKRYILYREEHRKLREKDVVETTEAKNKGIQVVKRDGEVAPLSLHKVRAVITNACAGIYEDKVDDLLDAVVPYFKDGMTTEAIQQLLMRVAVEKTSVKEPLWQKISGRFLLYDMYKRASINRKQPHELGYGNFYQLLVTLRETQDSRGNRLYGPHILNAYSKEEIDELEAYIKPERDGLFKYIGLKHLKDRYLIKGFNNEVMELPQECFMGVAMYLAQKEEDKIRWAKEFYDVLSKHQITLGTPTLKNARTEHPQLSSCFIEAVDDNLWSIYEVNTDFAKISKLGGGMGIYVGKVRGKGSDIRGVKNAAGGTVPWIKNYNNTAVAVDQLGTRSGSTVVSQDVWHIEILEFLDLKTNNGDERMKAHDIFPCVNVPDAFWKAVEEDDDWYLFCPHEIRKHMGLSLEDFWGEEWEHIYEHCIADESIPRKTVKAKDIARPMLRSQFETGGPFIFNRDIANRLNPNKHCGMIPSTNLCVEMCQNFKPVKLLEETIVEDQIRRVLEVDSIVTCNLLSYNLGVIYDDDALAYVVSVGVRMEDNAIDVNELPIAAATITNKKYRSIGMGTQGYHHHLTQKGIAWESDEHLEYVDAMYEKLNYYAIRASSNLAKERGSYPMFEGSDWQTGEYFRLRGYNSPKWKELEASVAANGLRNGYLLAVAPNGSTAIIIGETASTDPVTERVYVEGKKRDMVPVAVPDLTPETFWLYKPAHLIDQKWSVRAAGRRQKHIDQSQSFNLYIDPDTIKARDLLDLYLLAWKEGVKTIYYVRSRSTNIEECTACSA